MVMADNAIKEDELGFVFKLGKEAFGYSHKEVAQIFASIIQEKFVPSVRALS